MADYIPVINRNESVKLDVRDVLMVLRDRRKITLETDKKAISTYDSIKNVERFLKGDFVKCTEGCIINLAKVKEMSGKEVKFENGKVLILGRDSYVKIKQRFNAYLLGLKPQK